MIDDKALRVLRELNAFHREEMKTDFTHEEAQEVLHSAAMRHATEHIADYAENYSESRLWSKLRKVAKKAGKPVVQLVLTLFYVLAAADVSVKHKTLILGALGYFVLPLDLLPDVLVGIGYADDLTALLTVYNAVKQNITPAITAQVDAKLRAWKMLE